MGSVRLRTIVVDDEALGRDYLSDLLAAHRDIEIIEICCNGRLALDAIHNLVPDLVFLDMHMPGISGIDVMSLVDLPVPPMFIFATAHKHYAIKAFEMQATDYLLKPISRERVNVAVDNAVKRFQLALPSITEEMKAHRFGEQVVSISVKDKGFNLDIFSNQIDHIESAGDYACIFIGDRMLVKRVTLAELEEKLFLSGFRRINRSTIINLNFVERILSLAGNKYSVIMQDGKKFISNANRKQGLRLFFDISPVA